MRINFLKVTRESVEIRESVWLFNQQTNYELLRQIIVQRVILHFKPVTGLIGLKGMLVSRLNPTDHISEAPNP